MTAIEFRDYILKQMTAEKALLLLLEGQLREYEKLKFSADETAIHPVLLITMAAMEMNWQMAIPEGKDDEDVPGMIVGTEKYMEAILKNNNEDNNVIEKAQKHLDTYNYKHNND